MKVLEFNAVRQWLFHFFQILSTKSNIIETDVELHNSDRISINPSGSTLTISLVEKLDEGTYQCTADNLGGVAKASAKLTVSSIGTYFNQGTASYFLLIIYN